MKAVVVYESLWGNTAAVARAIAEGLGPGVPALSTAEAVGEAMAGVDLIVAGSPIIGFKLPSDKIRDAVRANPGPGAPRPPDLSHPSMSSWLKALPKGQGRSAAFETKIRGPWGNAVSAISKGLEQAGYTPLDKPKGFIVSGKFGPLRDGEVDKARAWGAELAKLMG
jgi:flavodoxin